MTNQIIILIRIPTRAMLMKVVVNTFDVGSSDADSVEAVELRLLLTNRIFTDKLVIKKRQQ